MFEIDKPEALPHLAVKTRQIFFRRVAGDIDFAAVLQNAAFELTHPLCRTLCNKHERQEQDGDRDKGKFLYSIFHCYIAAATDNENFYKFIPKSELWLELSLAKITVAVLT